MQIYNDPWKIEKKKTTDVSGRDKKTEKVKQREVIL